MPQPVLDQNRDLDGRELHRLASLYRVPEWVKAASMAEICGGDQIPAHMYADPASQLYPTHTKAATWTSAAFFFDKQAHFPAKRAETIRERLQRSAQFLGIGPDVEALAKRAEALSRDDDSTLPDDSFAYVGTDEEGRKERKLRLVNPAEVKAAAEWLRRYRDRLEFPERREIADKILRKAAEFGAAPGDDLDDFLEKSAGLGGCACATAVEAVRQRALLARAARPDMAAGLEKLAALLERRPEDARRPSTLQKLAHVLEIADRTLHVAYDGAIRRPEDVLFAITRKTAEAFVMGHVPTVSGTVYTHEDLGALRVRQVRDHLGDEVADRVTSDGLTVDPVKLAEILPTFTRGDAEAFDRMAQAAGVRPRYKEAAAKAQGLTIEDLREFASAHGSR